MEDFINRLKNVAGVRGEIREDKETLLKYSRDNGIFELKPRAVVFPESAVDVKALVSWVSSNKERFPNVSLTSWAGENSISGAGLSNSIIIDLTKRFGNPSIYENSEVEEVSAVLADGQAYVFGEISDRELENKLRLPGYEGEVYRKMFRLTKENFEDIQKARPAVTKDSAGYHLWTVWNKEKFNLAKLIAGSEGTLGMVIKVMPRSNNLKLNRRLMIVYLNKPKVLGQMARILEKYGAEKTDVFEGRLFRSALKFWPKFFAKFLGFSSKIVVVAEFVGEEDYIIEQMCHVGDEIKYKFKVFTKVVEKGESEQYENVREKILKILEKKIAGIKPRMFINDLIIHKGQAEEFLPKLETILRKYLGRNFVIFSNFTSGVVRVVPLMDLSKASERFIVPKIAEEVYNLTANFRGSISSSGGGILAVPFLEKMYGQEIVRLFERTKNIFDPQNIFNPGKKVGGSIEYIFSNIKKC